MSNDVETVEPETDSAAVFRRSWDVYQKFVTHNWMRHREVYGALREVIARRFGGGAISLADFGCGDAACTIAALEGTPVRQFIAVDRVPALLESARTALESRGCAVLTIEADLLEAVASPPSAPMDVLLAAYSLHHLSEPEKQQWLREARNWISDGGRLVLIDLLRRPGESRRRYLDRFYRHAGQRFGAFSPAEHTIVREHMEACDFPVTQAAWSELAASAGWNTPRLVYRDGDDLFAVLTCGPN